MSGGDVIAFSHARGGAHYRTSELAFLDSWEETSLFFHHRPSSKFGADSRNLLEDLIAHGLVHLGMIHEVWER